MEKLNLLQDYIFFGGPIQSAAVLENKITFDGASTKQDLSGHKLTCIIEMLTSQK